jgi:hypothetical protein
MGAVDDGHQGCLLDPRFAPFSPDVFYLTCAYFGRAFIDCVVGRYLETCWGTVRTLCVYRYGEATRSRLFSRFRRKYRRNSSSPWSAVLSYQQALVCDQTGNLFCNFM